LARISSRRPYAHARFLSRRCTGHSPAVQTGGGNLCQIGIRSGAFLIRLVASCLQHQAQAILLQRGGFRHLPA
jgi:hypothetical protein